MLNGKKIIVVLPSFNAEFTLEATYNEIPFDIVDDVVLVDDASTDHTVEVAKKLGIRHVIVHDRNVGYGGNQKSSYDRAMELNPDVIIMLHPDLSVSPEAYSCLSTGCCPGDLSGSYRVKNTRERSIKRRDAYV